MTASLLGGEVAQQITESFPDALIEASDASIVINSDSLLAVVAFLKETAGLDFDYLNSITAVDYYDYFELVYQLTSMQHNHSLILKTRCRGRENPTVSSIVSLYQGADFQEREIYDLMGISFEGHSNLKRIFLWEGFEGHPLRKDYL
jgi:NADH-quinone oxidoreductase subunit C